ncbi:YsnF/AvaK domain-containing protein [Muricoccus vinaceus]|uniref:YsnF/AvaK domain-containing protein n=1 Tax=Muricoccus vinaceus TaxID=424704 RepID=A0ABV6J1L5_9PROT
MTRTITGLFDDRAEAEAVASHLRSHDGIDASRIAIHGNTGEMGSAAGGSMTGSGSNDHGLWASLKDLFIADEDRQAYAEGIRRGGYVVSAEVDDTIVDHALDVFESHGAVDLDTREAEWRAGGWTGRMDDAEGTGMAMNTSSAVGAATMGGTSTPAMGTGMGVASPTAPGMTAGMGTQPAAGNQAGSRMAGAATSEERIPVVQEELRIGKREVDRGRVRVRSYIVETPVSESVTLHDEHVSVERRAVDQPLSAADDAFRERVIDAVEHSEEAVVSKEARVKEELVIRKEVGERTQNVTDTVRHTEVEVEDDRTAGSKASTTTGTTTGTSAKPRV